MIWVGLKKRPAHPHKNYPQIFLTNSIKCMNRSFFFSKTRYTIWVGLKKRPAHPHKNYPKVFLTNLINSKLISALVSSDRPVFLCFNAMQV